MDDMFPLGGHVSLIHEPQHNGLLNTYTSTKDAKKVILHPLVPHLILRTKSHGSWGGSEILLSLSDFTHQISYKITMSLKKLLEKERPRTLWASFSLILRSPYPRLKGSENRKQTPILYPSESYTILWTPEKPNHKHKKLVHQDWVI